MKVVKSFLFAQQLTEIFETTAEKWGLSQADIYTDGIQETIQLAAKKQKIWRKYLYYHEEHTRPVYYVSYKKHFVFFEVVEEQNLMIVLAIYHAAMDIPERLKDATE